MTNAKAELPLWARRGFLQSAALALRSAAAPDRVRPPGAPARAAIGLQGHGDASAFRSLPVQTLDSPDF